MKQAAPRVQLGITLGRLDPAVWEGAVVLVEALGFEPVWMSDHLAVPYRLDGQPAGARAEDKLAPTTPLFDPPSSLSFLPSSPAGPAGSSWGRSSTCSGCGTRS